MTKDDLIRMADLVGYDVDDDDDVYAPASGRYGLDPRLEHFAQLVAGYALRYECPDMSKKTQNVDTSEKCVHESDKSIHEEIERLKAEIKRANKLADYRLKLLMQMPKPWDTSDMAYRPNGLSIDQEPEAWMGITDNPYCDDADCNDQNSRAMRWHKKLLYLRKQEYSAPLNKEWVSLTDDEIHEVAIKCVKSGQSVNYAIRATEAKLKEKNNG